MQNNINNAIAEANRLSRAQAILAEGYVFSQDAETGTVFVSKPGKLSFEYLIGEQLDGPDGCSCPDHQRTGKDCKHMIAWDILQKQQKEEDEAEAAWIAEMEFRAEEAANADDVYLHF